MLKAAVLLQSEEGCTFAPTLTSKARHAPKNDKRPVRSFIYRHQNIINISHCRRLIQVHLRLTERGKLYNESIEQLRERMGKFDDEGNRLFTPAINRDSTRSVNHSFSSAQSPVALAGDLNAQSFNDGASSVGGQSHSHSHRGADGASTAAADEFLYQDARDREERFRVRERALQAQIESKAAASKINSSSIVLLRRKAVSFIIICCFCPIVELDFSYSFRRCWYCCCSVQDRDAKSAFKVLTGKGEEEGNEDHYLGKKVLMKIEDAVFTHRNCIFIVQASTTCRASCIWSWAAQENGPKSRFLATPIPSGLCSTRSRYFLCQLLRSPFCVALMIISVLF